MKKLFFAILLPFILIGCNNTENPVTNNSGSTDGTGTENISNSGNIETDVSSGTTENNSGSENLDQKVTLSGDLKNVFDDIDKIMGKFSGEVKETDFYRNIYDEGQGGRGLETTGYMISNDKIDYDSMQTLGDKIYDYFSTWRNDNYNVADGPGASLVGYYSGTIFCLHYAGITNPSDSLYDATEEDFKNFDYFTEINCTEMEKTKLDKLDGEFLFDAWGMEPMWGYEIKGNEIKLDTAYEVEIPAIKVTFEKILNNYYFSGENISGEITNEYCLGDGAGFSYNYHTKVTWGGLEYEGCAEKIPFFATGDNFFEYGKSGNYNEYVEKTGLDEKIQDDSNVKYSVDGVYKNFVQLSITETFNGEYAGGYGLIMQKTASGWEKIWEGQDIDYDSCKVAQSLDSGIWNWGPFRNCSEGMPRG